MSLYEKDSIVALATPRGIGAIAVIRVSGDSLSDLFFKLTNIKKIKPRYAYYKDILSSSGDVLDHSLVVFFRGPSSFTGEDVIEISCHGGEVVSKKIIDQIMAIKEKKYPFYRYNYKPNNWWCDRFLGNAR